MSKFKLYTCPICGYNDVGNVVYNDERGVVEEYIHCSRCNYKKFIITLEGMYPSEFRYKSLNNSVIYYNSYL